MVYTALHTAVRDGNLKRVKKVFEEVTFLVPLKLDDRTTSGHTALHIAAANGNSEIVAYLLGKNSEIDAVTEAGNSALHLAALGNHMKVCKQLAPYGADAKIKNAEDKQPWEMATDEALVQYLKTLTSSLASMEMDVEEMED